MKRSRRNPGGPTTIFLASLLVLIGLASGACRSEATPASAETAAYDPITITGETPPAWDEDEVAVGKGDTIIWKIGEGMHSVKFGPTACKTAQEKMTFDPPLVNCQSKVKETPGEKIVSAKVNQALDGDLHYQCGVHASMTGVLKPK